MWSVAGCWPAGSVWCQEDMGSGLWGGVGRNRTSTLILCGEDPWLGLFVCFVSASFFIPRLPLNTAGLPRPRQVLLHLWSTLSRLSYASHQHLDLYLISDPLPQLGPRWRGALCANTSQLVHIIIFFLRQPQ